MWKLHKPSYTRSLYVVKNVFISYSNDGNYMSWGDHFTVHTKLETLCCTHGTYIICQWEKLCSCYLTLKPEITSSNTLSRLHLTDLSKWRCVTFLKTIYKRLCRNSDFCDLSSYSVFHVALWKQTVLFLIVFLFLSLFFFLVCFHTLNLPLWKDMG